MSTVMPPLAVPVQAQQGQPIIITFGQPNIWSLEQAHYLLARMRAQTLKLQSKEFGAGDLDPNEITSTRIDVLKTLLGVGVGFNQGLGFQNEQAKKELTFNQDRRHKLLALRDQRQAELQLVNEQLATLRVEREKMNADAAASEAQKKVKDVEIDQKLQQQTSLNNGIQGLNTEITGITATATALSTPSPPSAVPSPLANSVIDKLLGEADFKKQLDNNPKLDASTRIDNYLNLQYEIIAKQLAVLRDEVGPGQRLVFVELPTSFYTVPNKSNRMVAQVWWRVESAYQRGGDRDQSQTRCENDQPDNIIKRNPGATEYRRKCNPYGSDQPRTEEEIKAAINGSVKTCKKLTKYEMDNNDWCKNPAINDVRTVDLIPRQSALNINDIQDRQKNFNLMGLFTWLSGLGVTVNYQRERQLYQQFLQQEVYASAFGKGTRDFGWTFGPRPGTERIAPGLQNTFAILVVPEKAEALKLKATGCYFPRTAYAPDNYENTNGDPALKRRCTDERDFDLVIPSTAQNNFWVTGLQYRPVRPNQRILVHVSGDYFSPQIGVLVNGAALRHSIGLAQSELAVAQTDSGFQPAPVGEFEFINSKQLVLAFSLGDFKGTPTITLVTPGRARVINNLRIVINESYKCGKGITANCPHARNEAGRLIYDASGNPVPVPYKLLPEDASTPEKDSIWVRLDTQPPMFSEASPAPVLAVDALKVFDVYAGIFRGHLTGSKLDSVTRVLINNVPAGLTPIAPGLIEVTFPATDAPTLEVTIIHDDQTPESSTYATKNFPNPAIARVDKISVTDYKPDAKPKPTLALLLEGVGLDHFSQVDAPGARILRRTVSPTTMVLQLRLYTKDETIFVYLRDARTGRLMPVAVDRPAEPASATAESEAADDSPPAKPAKTRAAKRPRPKRGK